MTKIAVVQHTPTFLNSVATVNSMCETLIQLSEEKTKLAIFPEAHICGYPAWIWRLRPGGDWGTYTSLHKQLLEQAIHAQSPLLEQLKQCCLHHNIGVLFGCHDKDNASSGTLYNTTYLIDDSGVVINRHRKLMPTNPERMVWGFGDASGLNVVSMANVNLGSLICWENYMPLARYALYAQDIQLYIAPTYDSGEDWLKSMSHIAREGKCYVVTCGVAIKKDDICHDIPDIAGLYTEDNEWINAGDSAVFSPSGECIAGPISNEHGILPFELDIDSIAIAKRALDVCGHYARPDIFKLTVNTAKQDPVDFKR
ncbi:carbon-nitrogen hydrolase family protein [Thalassotalea agarivorans]|uniref:Nitrilase n=1 Tax=Thalassotalea agarivorans TaxID=349064 RepID=A0A1I0D7F1_THASX|nr:carbon-nitrogen hydrolase family protein [Thalassotalea agarivorans]SET28144.1 nitrilase [Thalassotalea agarivorans]